MILTVIVFISILTVVVFVHELGHFMAARFFGVYVEEFGIGFPPRVVGTWVKNMQRRFVWWQQEPQDAFGRTIYSWNLLPIGGFVRLYGDGSGGEGSVIEPQNAHLTLGAKPAWQRLIIMLAGVIMNFLLAAGIFFVLLARNNFVSAPLPMIGQPQFAFGTTQVEPMVVGVDPQSPAARAGLQPQDRILDFRDTQAFISYVQNAPGKVQLRVHHIPSNITRTLELLPVYDKTVQKKRIGVELVNIVHLHYQKPHEKIFSGFLHGYNLLTYNVNIMQTMIGDAIKTRNPQSLGGAIAGPVGIGSVVGELLRQSGTQVYENLLNMAALLSLSLGFMNLLPFPALDGGRVALLLPELFTGKKVPESIERLINMGGFILLILLSIAVTIKDVFQLLR